MSPEQATGHNKDVGPQTDVFALGSITYEMLSGAPPFIADSVAKVVFRIAYEPHVPLEQVKLGLPARVYSAVARALEKEKAKRWESIAAFIAEFSGSPVPRTLPPVQNQELSSGVARPGMATPDSLAWGATSVHTPAPAALPPATAPASVAPLTPAAPPRSAMPFVAAALAALVLGLCGLVWLKSQPPEVSRATEAGRAGDRSGSAARAAGSAALPVEAVDAGAEVAAVPAPPRWKATAPSKKIPPEDVEMIAELERRLAGSKTPLERTRQGLKDLKSEVGLSRGYALSAVAACKEQSLMSAKPLFEKITERADRQYTVAQCRKYGVDLE